MQEKPPGYGVEDKGYPNNLQNQKRSSKNLHEKSIDYDRESSNSKPRFIHLIVQEWSFFLLQFLTALAKDPFQEIHTGQVQEQNGPI